MSVNRSFSAHDMCVKQFSASRTAPGFLLVISPHDPHFLGFRFSFTTAQILSRRL